MLILCASSLCLSGNSQTDNGGNYQPKVLPKQTDSASNVLLEHSNLPQARRSDMVPKRKGGSSPHHANAQGLPLNFDIPKDQEEMFLLERLQERHDINEVARVDHTDSYITRLGKDCINGSGYGFEGCQVYHLTGIWGYIYNYEWCYYNVDSDAGLQEWESCCVSPCMHYISWWSGEYDFCWVDEGNTRWDYCAP